MSSHQTRPTTDADGGACRGTRVESAVVRRLLRGPLGVSLVLHLALAVWIGTSLVSDPPPARQATTVEVRASAEPLQPETPPTDPPPPEAARAEDEVELRDAATDAVSDVPPFEAPGEWTGPSGVSVLSAFADRRLGPRPRRTPEPARPEGGLAVARAAPGATPPVAAARPAPEPSPEPVFAAARARADNAPPRYPERALRRGWTGVVVLDLHVGPDGTVMDVEIVEGSGHEALDRAATRAARDWCFDPARCGDTPVASVVRRRVRFAL